MKRAFRAGLQAVKLQQVHQLGMGIAACIPIEHKLCLCRGSAQENE